MMKREKQDVLVKADPAEWFARARKDVEFARMGRDRKLWVESVLFCQRSVEKALTAYLSVRMVAFAMTHDVLRLFRIAQGDEAELGKWADDAAWLAAFKPEVPGTATTAPAKLPPAGPADLDRALGFAQALLEWVGERLPPPGSN